MNNALKPDISEAVLNAPHTQLQLKRRRMNQSKSSDL